MKSPFYMLRGGAYLAGTSCWLGRVGARGRARVMKLYMRLGTIVARFCYCYNLSDTQRWGHMDSLKVGVLPVVRGGCFWGRGLHCSDGLWALSWVREKERPLVRMRLEQWLDACAVRDSGEEGVGWRRDGEDGRMWSGLGHSWPLEMLHFWVAMMSWWKRSLWISSLPHTSRH